MEHLNDLFKTLKLQSFCEGLESTLERYPESREDILKALQNLCESEITQKQTKTIAYRIALANFGIIQTVDTFDFNYNASTKKIKNRYLKLYTPDLTSQGLSVLLVGSAGLGKTHLAKALGYYLCQERQRVFFTTLSKMVINLTAADAAGTLKRTMHSYTQPTLLIIDEIGYITLRELESNLVFQIISQRYENRRSTVVTTNRSFGEWNQIFHNDAMAHALLDRLIERSEVFHLEGNKSYREAHRQSLESK